MAKLLVIHGLSTMCRRTTAVSARDTTRGASVIVLHGHTADDLLLVTVGLHLELCLTYSARPVLAPLTCGGCVRILEAALDALPLQHGALRVRDEKNVVVRHREVVQTETRVAALVLGRLNDAVDGRFVVSTGEEFHGVPRINDLRNGRMAQPGSSWYGTVLTTALGMCLTQRHFPSGDITWRAATG